MRRALKTRDASGLFLLLDHNAGLLALHIANTAFTFLASKIVWAVISPDSLIVILGVGAWFALIFGWHRWSRRLLAACALLLLLIGSMPVGEWLIAPLENRFAVNAALPAEVNGIIVLGGMLDPMLSNVWNQAEIGGAADRLTSFLRLHLWIAS